jgi:hypothetical protein
MSGLLRAARQSQMPLGYAAHLYFEIRGLKINVGFGIRCRYSSR